MKIFDRKVFDSEKIFNGDEAEQVNFSNISPSIPEINSCSYGLLNIGRITMAKPIPASLLKIANRVISLGPIEGITYTFYECTVIKFTAINECILENVQISFALMGMINY